MNSPQEEQSLGRGDRTGDSTSTSTSRRFTDLQKTITMAQIAKAAGVSQGAISSLLNDRDYGIRVSEKTRERVFRVCRDMGYLPNDLRAVVRMYPELGSYALLISKQLGIGLEFPFVSRLAGAAMRAVPDDSRPLTFAFYDEFTDYSANTELLPDPVRNGIASRFIGLGAPNLSLLHVIVRRGLSFVSLGSDVVQPGVTSFVPDYARASQLALEAFAKQGHKRVAIVSGPFGTTDPQTVELNRGVRVAYERLGLVVDTQNIIYGDLTFAAGLAAADTLLTRKPEPTAIFCMNDAVAGGVIAQAQARGRKVPADVSVIGCGDDPMAVAMLPELATIHIPAEEMGRLAIGEADRLIRDGISSEPERKVLSVRLVERASLGPPRKG